jgi:hypothetical protein
MLRAYLIRTGGSYIAGVNTFSYRRVGPYLANFLNFWKQGLFLFFRFFCSKTWASSYFFKKRGKPRSIVRGRGFHRFFKRAFSKRALTSVLTAGDHIVVSVVLYIDV